MTALDAARLGSLGRKPVANPEDDLIPRGGISLREAMRAVGSGRAVLQPTGVAITYLDGSRFRAVAGQPGLLPEAE